MLRARVSAAMVTGCLVIWGAAAQAADPPKADIFLKYRPRQEGVVYGTPDAREAEACKVEADKGKVKGAGWLLRDGQGRPLRRFFDSQYDGVHKSTIDIWSYYHDGIETYREQYVNTAAEPDQMHYRWLNHGGSKWGIDLNKDGKIDTWKVISPEEISQEIVQAVIKNDFGRLQALMLTDADLKALDLPADVAKRVRDGRCRRRPVQGDRHQAGPGREGALAAPGNRGAAPDSGRERPRRSGARPWHHRHRDGGQERVDPDRRNHPGRLGLAPGRGTGGRRDGRQVRADGDRQSRIAKAAERAEHAGRRIRQEDRRQAGRRGQVQPGSHWPDREGRRGRQDGRRAWPVAPPAGRLPERRRSEQPAGRPGGLRPADGPGRAAAKVTAGRRRPAGVRHVPRDAGVVLRPDAAEGLRLQEGPRGLAGAPCEIRQGLPQRRGHAGSALGAGWVSETIGKEIEAKNWYEQLVKDFADKPQGAKAKGAIRRLALEGNELALAGPTLDGGTFDMGKLRGKVVVVYYWYTFNGGPVGDFAKLKLLLDSYAKQGLEVVTVSLDNSAKEAADFVKKTSAPGTHLYQDGAMDSKYAVEYGVMMLPNMFLVGKDGKVVSRTLQVNNLEDEIKKQIAK